MALFGAHTTQHRTSGVFTGLLLGSIPSPGLRRPWEPSRETRGRVSSRSRSRPSVPGGAGGVGRRGRRTGTRRRPSAASWNRRRPCSRSRPTACRIPWLSLHRRAPLPPARRSAAVRFRLTPRPPRVTWELGADTAALLAGTCSPQRREVQGGNCGAPSRRGGGRWLRRSFTSGVASGARRPPQPPGSWQPRAAVPRLCRDLPQGPACLSTSLDPDFSQLGPFRREAHTTGCPEGG